MPCTTARHPNSASDRASPTTRKRANIRRMQCTRSFEATRSPAANASMFAKVSEGESRELLDLLFAQVTKPQYVYRHKWRVGGLLMWDNCAVQHLASFDYALPLRRLMERTTVEGSVPYWAGYHHRSRGRRSSNRLGSRERRIVDVVVGCSTSSGHGPNCDRRPVLQQGAFAVFIA
jgi:hypothetical protein